MNKLPELSVLDKLNKSGFEATLRFVLEEGKANFLHGNWDYRRFGPEAPAGVMQRIKELVWATLVAMGWYASGVAKKIMESKAKLGWLYNKFVDDESKEI